MKDFDGTICAIGGGKGGVGKSFIAANLACALAREGCEVILADADLAGANVHTLFGIRHPPLTLQHFLDRTVDRIDDVLISTPLKNLKLVCGATDFIELANPRYAQKQRIIRAIGGLAADYLLIDIGAGATLNNLDFFNMADLGIIVTTPDPTALLNGYEFLKMAVRRKLIAAFSDAPAIKEKLAAALGGHEGGKVPRIGDVIDSMREADPDAARRIASVIDGANYRLIANAATETEGERVLRTIAGVAGQYLKVRIPFLGSIPRHADIERSIRTMTPLLLSGTATAAIPVRAIARRIIAGKRADDAKAGDGPPAPAARTAPGSAPEEAVAGGPPLLGLNEEIVREGKSLHVQTEDLGPAKSQVLTLVFRGGRIVFSKSTGYAELGVEGLPRAAIGEKVRWQHKAIIAGIRAGKIDAKIAETGVELR